MKLQVFYRSRLAAFGLVSALALGAAACGQQAHATPPVIQTSAAATPAQAAPPLSTVTLPPAPVPATFDVAALSEQVRPMVVNITVTQSARRGGEGMDPFDFFFGPQGQRGGPRGQAPQQKPSGLGSGFIIDPNGYVITNAHVVEDAEDVRVRLADDREFDAEVVGRDPKLDLALLKLEGATNLPASPLGSSEALRVGEHVLAVGNPFGLGHTVTLGIVSAKARSIGAGPYDDFIQTDAAINPGNSGGPLFNWRGEVVGINTAIRAGANSIGFAVPIDALRDVLPQLRERGFVQRGKLGLGFQPMTRDLASALGLDAPRGALVSQVEPGGPAAKAGIRPGDVIVSVNNAAIHSAEELPRNVARNAPGSEITVTLVRNKEQKQVKAQLALLEDEEAAAPTRSRQPGASQAQPQSTSRLGMEVSNAPGGGVRVESVTGNNAAELLPGDVITEINGTPVKDVSSLGAAMNKVKPGSTALVRVQRGKVSRFAAVQVPSK